MPGALWNTARRLLFRLPNPSMRRAGQASALWLLLAAPAAAEGVTSASFAEPTRRYAHGVLGDAIEYGSLHITSGNRTVEVVLPQDHVFEDLAPRFVDIDLDGAFEVMVVESDVTKGAQLAVYSAVGEKIAETPHIGQRNRWLAPIGAADLDGDGYVELAYIDRPHLAKTLRVWRYRAGGLTEVADLQGLTNHKIGQDFITSGLRDCDAGVELITADANWRNVMATRLEQGRLKSRAIGPFKADRDLKKALSCRN